MKRTIAIILSLLIILVAIPFASAETDEPLTEPIIELTSVPKLGSKQNLKGRVYLPDENPADYAIIVIIAGSYPKPTYANYLNKLEKSSKGWATFSCSITTGGNDENINTFNVYLVERSKFVIDGYKIPGEKISDAYLQDRFVDMVVGDKTAFNDN